ncbi:D-tyrosyl-tRNA(Tyr) deacylase [Desmospora sp. 8437]|nr:D-tyrosyl-tRNA(Tyr) deacylase [Desmospora sp. 8437]
MKAKVPQARPMVSGQAVGRISPQGKTPGSLRSGEPGVLSCFMDRQVSSSSNLPGSAV